MGGTAEGLELQVFVPWKRDESFFYARKEKIMYPECDEIIVGSAIVKIVAQYGKDSVPKVAEYVKQMKEAVAEA